MVFTVAEKQTGSVNFGTSAHATAVTAMPRPRTMRFWHDEVQAPSGEGDIDVVFLRELQNGTITVNQTSVITNVNPGATAQTLSGTFTNNTGAAYQVSALTATVASVLLVWSAGTPRDLDASTREAASGKSSTVAQTASASTRACCSNTCSARGSPRSPYERTALAASARGRAASG